MEEVDAHSGVDGGVSCMNHAWRGLADGSPKHESGVKGVLRVEMVLKISESAKAQTIPVKNITMSSLRS